ncbi:MAG: D-2-hydroxyacid dehydrogenase [Thermodesulfovibrionia bacterium]|nr:D-2-hydroxyacid dehydrogenase [Thermodesulfovibrionia bacterium]
MKITVLDGYTLNPGDNSWDEVAAMGDFTVYNKTPGDKIIERAQGVEIILTNKTPLTAETLAQLKDLRFISVLATGYNVVDIVAAQENGVLVANVPVYGTDSVAQFAFALIMELCHQVGHHSRAVKEGRWSGSEHFCFWDSPLIELKGKTMGLVGFGRIGRRTGEIACGFGLNVLAADPFKDNPPSYPFTWKEIPEVFEESDIVSLHCPQTKDNTGMVNQKLLSTMKPSAFFINAARGGLVDEEALAHALKNGIIAGAACDVVSTEPIQPDNPLLKAPNIILTPHIAWASLEARKRLMKTTAENIQAFLNNKPINIVS